MPKSLFFSNLSRALLGVVICVSLWALTREWDKPLLDLHSFRQTQTAISTYYMVGKPSVFLDYITPVLGKPWRIPMEVPFYQWGVARLRELTGMGLDQCGKLFSIIFLFACIWPMWRLQAALDIPLMARSLTAAIFLSVPLHLYWGRAFLIETLALFLSLSMVSYTFTGYRSKNWRLLAVGLVFGTLAALCKITTWAVACGVTGLLALFSDGLPRRKNFAWLLLTGAVATSAIVPEKLWLKYTDAVKEESPFARDMILSTSQRQIDWSFGTPEQKTNPEVWKQIGRYITDQLFTPVPILSWWLIPLILIAGGAASPRRIPLILMFLAGFAAGPLVFTNLYFVHNYYLVGNSAWLLLALGTALAGIAEWSPNARWPLPVAVTLCAVVCIAGFAAWHQKFLPLLQSLPTREALAEAWTKPLQEIVPPSRTVLIIGNDWTPNSLYYAERKGVAFPSLDWIPLSGPHFQDSLKNFGPEEQLGAVVLNEQLLAPANQAFFTDFLKRLGMSLTGKRTAFGVLFPASDLNIQK
jgi:hypothetical protein